MLFPQINQSIQPSLDNELLCVLACSMLCRMQNWKSRYAGEGGKEVSVSHFAREWGGKYLCYQGSLQWRFRVHGYERGLKRDAIRTRLTASARKLKKERERRKGGPLPPRRLQLQLQLPTLCLTGAPSQANQPRQTALTDAIKAK